MEQNNLRRFAWLTVIAVIAGAGFFWMPQIALAHGDEDHGEAAPQMAQGPLLPRFSASSDALEVVGVLRGKEVDLFVDNAKTNAPVSGLSIEISADEFSVRATEVAAGEYRAELSWLGKPDHYPLIFVVDGEMEGDAFSDLLEATLDSVDMPALITPAMTKPASMRLADGQVAMYKATQHLLGIRTLPARFEDTRRAIALNGKVIADPTASGVVQTIQAGRIGAPEAGFPVLGQRVKAGEVLAWLEPAISSLERANQEAALAELDAQLKLAHSRSARLESLRGSVPNKEIEAAKVEVHGLEQRRRALAASVGQREVLRAPMDGVIGTANVVVGQVVNAGDTLFTLLQPNRLWVESLAYDASPLQKSAAARSEGVTFSLAEISRGAVLQDQAVPILYRILPPVPAIPVGQPVTVLAESQTQVNGVIVPSEALMRNGQGEWIVWLHDAAERFRPMLVQWEALDGARSLVRKGLHEGDRVVIRGAASLSQVR
ncbi:Hypothetical protein HDN1F_00390 [gamma proteobacterium HdN1]|nr:Hypothetical protein HDN1F_00390 [gamma proteobacterium HdN1]